MLDTDLIVNAKRDKTSPPKEFFLVGERQKQKAKNQQKC